MLLPILICWSPIGNFRQNFSHQIFFSLAIVTKMVAAWSAELRKQLHVTKLVIIPEIGQCDQQDSLSGRIAVFHLQTGWSSQSVMTNCRNPWIGEIIWNWGGKYIVLWLYFLFGIFIPPALFFADWLTTVKTCRQAALTNIQASPQV